MAIFLTSSPSGSYRNSDIKGLDERNSFVKNLRKVWIPGRKGVIVSSDPDAFKMNDEMKAFFEQAFCDAGVPVTEFEVWDNRREDFSYERMEESSIVMLAGGHVPTQNAFFKRIGLKETIQKYSGVILGVSAGTMNSAKVVYAQPELPGESTDPCYERFLEGLGLTDIMVLPHYQEVREMVLDGKQVIGDITVADSYGHKFLALVDGSYLMISDGATRLYGEAYRISDGRIVQICRENERMVLE